MAFMEIPPRGSPTKMASPVEFSQFYRFRRHPTPNSRRTSICDGFCRFAPPGKRPGYRWPYIAALDVGLLLEAL